MALQWGWSINLGGKCLSIHRCNNLGGHCRGMDSRYVLHVAGGMHHASFDRGGGWCVYDDWTLALRKLRRETGGAIRRAMLVDLDVHQASSELLACQIPQCRLPNVSRTSRRSAHVRVEGLAALSTSFLSNSLCSHLLLWRRASPAFHQDSAGTTPECHLHYL